MNRGGRARRPGMFHDLPALTCHTISRTKDRLRCRGPKTNQNLGTDDCEFLFKPRPAGPDFPCARLLVNPALPALFELEMLPPIRHKCIGTVNPRFPQSPIKESTRRPDKRL